jgi:osmoprotectant transport system substrate-binding protein
MSHSPTGATAPPSRRYLRVPALALLGILAAIMLAACGSKSTSSSSSSTPASSSSSAPASSASGGKALTLGTKDFPEEYIIGALYKQALEAKGYTVNYKPSVGATEVIDKALTSGQIDAYPEYTGESVATVAKITTQPSTPRQEYDLAKAFYAKRGEAMSSMTPFFDTDAIGVRKAYATKYGLVSTGDLKKVPHWTVGARPEFQGRVQGAVGLRQAYGLHNFTFKSLALGIQYQALDSGAVDGADVFTTDAQLASGKYVTLKDPKNIFGFQNVALVISKKKLDQLGGQKFLSIIDRVNALLTASAIIPMNKAVALDKQQPADVAQKFLKANGIL